LLDFTEMWQAGALLVCDQS